MGNKVYQIFEYAYIALAIFSVYLVVSNWELDRGKAYLFAMFAVVAVFMFFFKRKFRKNIEKKNNNE